MSRRGAGKIWTVQWRLQPAHQVPCGVREGNGSSSQSRSICQQSWQVSTPHVCAVHTHSRKPFHVPLHVLPLLQQSMMSPMNLCAGRVIQNYVGYLMMGKAVMLKRFHLTFLAQVLAASPDGRDEGQEPEVRAPGLCEPDQSKQDNLHASRDQEEEAGQSICLLGGVRGVRIKDELHPRWSTRKQRPRPRRSAPELRRSQPQS